jgi:hypothetical protein
MMAPRILTAPKTFILEVGKDGFNAYEVHADGSRELFAASSAASTFVKAVERIFNSNGNAPNRFTLAEVVS